MANCAPLHEDLSGFASPEIPHVAFALRHRLSGHPLLTVDGLLALCRRLPPEQVEWNAGEMAENTNRNDVPMNGLSAEETVRRIAECRSWMALKNVETDPAFGEIVDQILDEVQEATRRTLPGMFHRQGFLFLSSPGSVTPLHADPEHNILHQIQGTKIVRLWDPRKPENITDREMEGFFAGTDHRGFAPRPPAHVELEAELKPGDGLHFPYMAPHIVRNGPEVSISLSTTWQSTFSKRKVSVHCWNARMRKRGLSPAEFGARPWVDGLKYGTMQLVRGVKRLAGRGEKAKASPRY